MSYYRLISIMPKSSVDPDAQAFITAAAITDPTQQQAINTLVVDLKGYGIWSKMKAIYPFVGGTAAQHKWNLKDPRDLDAAFRLVFNGGWTHSSTGALPNGTNAYADTKLSASVNLTNYNTHTSYYSRTNNNGTYIEMGWHIGNGQRDVSHIKYSGSAYYDQYDVTTGRLTINMASINSTGLFVANRTANNLQKAYRNGSILGTNSNTITSFLGNLNYYLGAINGLPFYTNRQCAFASIGDGLTDTEASNFYTSVQAFQTTLSRNV